MPYPDGLPAREALSELQKRVQLTPYESGFYESGHAEATALGSPTLLLQRHAPVVQGDESLQRVGQVGR